jgi:hypothetical protein
MPNDALHELRELAIRARARDLPRVMASASLAIHKGMAPAAVLASLTRNAGYLFDATVASRRRDSEAFRLTPRRRLCGNRRFERCTI